MSLFSHAVSCPPLGPASTESNLGNLTCPFRQCPGLSEGWVVCGWEQDFHNRSKASARHNFSYLSNMTVHERETQCPRHGHRWFSKSSTGCVPQTKWLNLQPLYPRDVARAQIAARSQSHGQLHLLHWPLPCPTLNLLPAIRQADYQYQNYHMENLIKERYRMYMCPDVSRPDVESLRLLLYINYQKKLISSEKNQADFKQNLEVL